MSTSASATSATVRTVRILERPALPACPGASLLQDIVGLDLERLPRGYETEGDAGRECGEDRERQHARVDAGALHQREGGSQLDEHADAREGDQQSHSRSDEREHETLRQPLLQDTPRRRSQRQAEGDFFLAGRAAGQNRLATFAQAIDQHEEDATHEKEEGGPNGRHGVLLKSGDCAAAASMARIEPGHDAHHSIHVCPGLRDRSVGLEPGDHTIVVTAAGEVRRRRDPDIRRPGRRLKVGRKIESGRHHARRRDDPARQSESYGRREPDQNRTASATGRSSRRRHQASRPPSSLRNGRPSIGVARSTENSSGETRDADQHFRVVAESQSKPPVSEERHAFEDAVLAPPVLEIRVGRPIAPSIGQGIRFPDLDQLIRVRIGERPNESGVHHAEDRGVCADGKSERQHAHSGEARFLARPRTAKRTSRGTVSSSGRTRWSCQLSLADSTLPNFKRRRTSSRGRRHTEAHIVFSLQLDMRLDLGRELVVDIRTTQHFEESTPESTEQLHGVSPVMTKSRETSWNPTRECHTSCGIPIGRVFSTGDRQIIRVTHRPLDDGRILMFLHLIISGCEVVMPEPALAGKFTSRSLRPWICRPMNPRACVL